MAHVFPRHRLLDGQPIDAIELNEDLRPVVEELEGRLNEHNFSNSAFWSYGYLKDDAVYTVHHTYKEVPVARSTHYELSTTSGGYIQPPGAYRIPSAPVWLKIDDMSVAFTTGTTTQLWILGSFQLDAGPISTVPVHAVTTPNADYWSELQGVQFGIKVDGTIIYETVVGSADRANDGFGEGYNGDVHPIVVEAFITLPAGNHTVELVARCVRHRQFSVMSSDVFYEVFNRELIVIEGI